MLPRAGFEPCALRRPRLNIRPTGVFCLLIDLAPRSSVLGRDPAPREYLAELPNAPLAKARRGVRRSLDCLSLYLRTRPGVSLLAVPLAGIRPF